jgi:hypothetical protein
VTTPDETTRPAAAPRKRTRRGPYQRRPTRLTAPKRGRRASKAAETPCAVPDCSRPGYARGLCQTHHRQLITTGRIDTIRPYRKRAAGTVKFASLRLTPGCAGVIQQHAKRKGVSPSAAIAEILERWARALKRREGERP